jgi:multidrug efflux pump subunit AcrA (membrane-fusion protein)
MDSYKGQVFEAKVSKIVPIMNERNKTFLIEADFNKAPEKLYPNLSAEANIVIQTKEQALLIPRNLLVDQQYVLLANGERRLVQTGLADYEQVEILSGITTADELLMP